jgi:hypothetical protein
MSFWNANSDRDYFDEIHRYDEPSTTRSLCPRGCKCQACVRAEKCLDDAKELVREAREERGL